MIYNVGRTPAKVAWRAGHANICRLLERWSAPSAPQALEVPPVAAHRPPSAGTYYFHFRFIIGSYSIKCVGTACVIISKAHAKKKNTANSTIPLSNTYVHRMMRVQASGNPSNGPNNHLTFARIIKASEKHPTYILASQYPNYT